MLKHIQVLKNYIYGEYSLAKTFWLGMLFCYIPLVMAVIIVTVCCILSDRIAVVLWLLSKLLYCLYYPLAIIFPIATFNASKRYTGRRIWGILATGYSVLLAISAIWALTK